MYRERGVDIDASFFSNVFENKILWLSCTQVLHEYVFNIKYSICKKLFSRLKCDKERMT